MQFSNSRPYELLVVAFAVVVIACDKGVTMGTDVAAGLLVASCWLALWRAYQAFVETEHLKKQLTGYIACEGSPWGYQRKLMRISGQEMPTHPRLTKTSILYGALMLEELGEMFLGLAKAIEEGSSGRTSTLFSIAKKYAHIAIVLHNASIEIRDALKDCSEDPNEIYLAFDTAKEMLDGAIDLVVVTCGFTISTGLPDMDAYVEVVTSNLSKANPLTGMIDKTPDGKWIKGVEYKEPNLDPILQAYYNAPQQ